MNKNIIIGGVAVVVLIGGAFYGGIAYAAYTTPARGQFTADQFGGMRGTRNGMGGFTAGQILSKDAQGVTIKMQDGSTKIVFISANTQITKSVSGTSADLAPDTNITVSGSTNSDGSLTAQMIQIRPATTTRP